MNERIRELAKQADGVFIHKLMTGAKQYTFLEKDLEKFAELIVRECARLAIEKQTENDVLNIVSENPAKDFAYALVKHFGVEE